MFGVEAKNELENTVSTIELSEMIAESLSEGLLDPEEHNRLSRALQIRNRIVADIAVPVNEIHAVPAAADGTGPTVAAIQQALAETGYSRFPVVDPAGRFTGYVHIKDVLPLVDDPDAVVDPSLVRPLPRVLETLPLPDALSRLRRNNSHLALVTAAEDRVTAMVTLEDLVEDWWGPCATELTVSELVLDLDLLDIGVDRARTAHLERVDRFVAPHSAAPTWRSSPGVGFPVQLLQPEATPAASLASRIRRGTRRCVGPPLPRAPRLRRHGSAVSVTRAHLLPARDGRVHR